MARTPTPYWRPDQLLTSLSNAGWGELSGGALQGIRTTLEALRRSLPPRTGQGETTVWQIAQKAGLSERWVRRCLGVLEEAGVISWHRGGVAYGRPRPSSFRINKKVLVAMINGARPVMDVLRARRKAQTDARLAGLWFVKTKRGQTRRSVHAELSADLPSLAGDSPPPRGGVDDDEPPNEPLSPQEQAWLDDWFAKRALRRERLGRLRRR